jgi:hypothetical protein
MKNEPQDPIPRRMTVATKKEWASVTPFGSPGHKTDFTAGRIAIETLDGTVLNERLNPAGHAEVGTVDAPWDPLDRAYFNGYALWTYLTTPFLLAMPGSSAEEIDPCIEDGEPGRDFVYSFPRKSRATAANRTSTSVPITFCGDTTIASRLLAASPLRNMSMNPEPFKASRFPYGEELTCVTKRTERYVRS